jgi:adenosylmethionine-8-amino-7-oxononanoate aminotransferase
MRPAINDYPASGEAVQTPSIHSTPVHDVYLTLATTASGTKPVTIGVIIEPLVQGAAGMMVA